MSGERITPRGSLRFSIRARGRGFGRPATGAQLSARNWSRLLADAHRKSAQERQWRSCARKGHTVTTAGPAGKGKIRRGNLQIYPMDLRCSCSVSGGLTGAQDCRLCLAGCVHQS